MQKQDKLDKRAAALRDNLKRRKTKQQEQDTQGVKPVAAKEKKEK